MKALALATYDSFINTAKLILPYFAQEGCDVELAIVRARRTGQLSSEQINQFDLDECARWISIETLVQTQELSGYDIVLCCLDGVSMRRLNHYVSTLKSNRPLLIAVYPGLILRYPYDGYSMRSGVDLLWLNCEADKAAYENMAAAFGIHKQNARVLGNVSLLKPVQKAHNTDTGPIVFFEQAIIPRGYHERLYLVHKLVQLAELNPTYEIIIKARVLGKNRTLHRAQYPIDRLLNDYSRKTGYLPPNLTLTEEVASNLLSKASHCLTVSSTVAIEAIHAGVPTAIIGDYGAHDDYGLHYFFGSGLIRNFADLKFPFLGTPHQAWINEKTADPNLHIGILIKEAINLSKNKSILENKTETNAELSDEFRLHLIKNIGHINLISRDYKLSFFLSNLYFAFKKYFSKSSRG